VVNAFSASAGGGNSAAVVFGHTSMALELAPAGNAGASALQAVAAEFNLAETAFVRRVGPAFTAQPPTLCAASDPSSGAASGVGAAGVGAEGAVMGASAAGGGASDHFELRWFTPVAEVDLCGHATLAAAHALLSTGRAAGPVTFHTRSGRLTVATAAPGGGLVMDFPAEPAAAWGLPDDASKVQAVASCLNLSPSDLIFCGKNRMDCLAEISPEAFMGLGAPDLALVAALPCRGLIVTTAWPRLKDILMSAGEGGGGNLPSCPPDGASVDFVSRFFAPQIGIPEDPVSSRPAPPFQGLTKKTWKDPAVKPTSLARCPRVRWCPAFPRRCWRAAAVPMLLCLLPE